MAWLKILKGQSITIEGEYYDLGDTILADVKKIAAQHQLEISETVNSEEDITVIVLGASVLPAPHFYAGKTVTLNEVSLPEQINVIFEQLCQALSAAGHTLYNHNQGVIVSQFD